MNMIRAIPALALFALTTTAGLCPAQTAPGPTRAYHLLRSSDIQEGCFAPCLCPISIEQPLRGGFSLTLTGNDGLFTNYRVSRARLTAPTLSRVYLGDGDYRIGGEFGLVQQMRLNLSANAAAIQHFDSGVVAASGPVPRWPRIDLTLARNNFFCFDTALHIVAVPVADWNGDGSVGVGDLFGFLESYFAGDGDADDNGQTSVDDIFMYLAEFFQPS